MLDCLLGGPLDLNPKGRFTHCGMDDRELENRSSREVSLSAKVLSVLAPLTIQGAGIGPARPSTLA